ncbi:PREDICTED: F-box protein At4g00893-like [Camelina sativa]|uniref:F-box protein At4g00893-like n=1 Tax=Camelina sativa TaxID=90675 RepID=A0ABM0TB12_CAMSA|nr:PREDICTED: F-box protein At4g00893-like [Camelina sativa]
MASPSSMSPATVSRRGSRSPSKKALMNPSFADLPSDILRMILSPLILEDNIRASAACKSWCEAGVSVRIVEKHPWLMCFRKGGDLVELRDPLQWNLYTLSLPELAESTVCYSRDGWLLMDKTGSKDVFFFNPFSRELITLPECELEFDTIAFSCSPTSDNCVVVAIRFTYYAATISTCHPGDDKWVTATFASHGIGVHKRSNLVYLNDRFYCINAAGFLSNFHPSSGTWTPYGVHRLRCPYMYDRKQYGRKAKAVALAEKEGELFVMYACMNEKPMVYKLVSKKWEEVSKTTLDSLTIFFSFHNSELRTNLPWMRSKVYFSRFGDRKRCLSYSFDKSMCNRKRRASYSCDESMCRPGEESRSWIELCRRQILWIDPPPKNLLDLMLSSSHNN